MLSITNQKQIGTSRYLPFDSESNLISNGTITNPIIGFLLPNDDVLIDFYEINLGNKFNISGDGSIRYVNVFEGNLQLFQILNQSAINYGFGLRYVDLCDDDYVFPINDFMSNNSIGGSNFTLSIDLFKKITRDVAFTYDEISYISSSIAQAILTSQKIGSLVIPSITLSSQYIVLGGWEWGQGNSWNVAGWFGPSNGSTNAHFSGGNQPFSTNPPFNTSNIVKEEIGYPYIFFLNGKWCYGKIGLYINGHLTLGEWFSSNTLLSIDDSLNNGNFNFFEYRLYYDIISNDFISNIQANSTIRIFNGFTSLKPTLKKFVSCFSKNLNFQEFIADINLNLNSNTKPGPFAIIV